jgi:hypothetical protein
MTIFLITQALAGWRQAQLLEAQEVEAARVVPPEPPPQPRPPVL